MSNNIQLGIIGFGDMGKLYAKAFKIAGWKHINVCDVPAKYDELLVQFGEDYNVFRDGFAVARRSDFVLFSVEAANIDKVVSMYGPCMKVGAIASGQVGCGVNEPAYILLIPFPSFVKLDFCEIARSNCVSKVPTA